MTRLGVDILGKSQREKMGTIAAARAEAKSPGSTHRPFQVRRDQTIGTVHSLTAFTELPGTVGYNPGGVQTTHPGRNQQACRRCCMDLRIPSPLSHTGSMSHNSIKNPDTFSKRWKRRM